MFDMHSKIIQEISALPIWFGDFFWFVMGGLGRRGFCFVDPIVSLLFFFRSSSIAGWGEKVACV